MSAWLGKGVPAAVLAAAALLFWKLRIVDSATIPIHIGNVDLFTQIYPMQRAIFDAWRAGEIPLWNPHQFAGAPLLATYLYGALYPGNVAHLVLPTALALEVTTVLHFLGAGLFTALYARQIGIGAVGALAAGLLYMLAPPLVGLASWFTSIHAAAIWLPAAFLAGERLLETRRAVWVAGLAVATAMPLLAGSLQHWSYGVYALALYALFRLAARAREAGVRGRLPEAALLLAGIALGVGLAAAQILPTAELSLASARRPDSLAPGQLESYGALAPSALWLQAFAADGMPPLRHLYIGALGLLCILVAAGAGRGGLRLPALATLAAAGVVLSVGDHTPVFAWFQGLPTGGWFRDPERALFVSAFAVAVLVGAGVDVLARRSWRPLLGRGGAPLLFATLVALGVAAAADPGSLAQPLAWLGLACGWATAGAPGPRTRVAFQIALVAALALQTAAVSRNPYLRPYHGVEALAREAAVFRFIREHQGLDRTYIHSPSPIVFPAMAKQGTLRGLYSITDYEPLSLERFARFYRLLEGPRPAAAQHDPFAGRLHSDSRSTHFSLVDLLSVRFIATTRDTPVFRNGQRAGWRRVFAPARSRFEVYERADPLPRAYVVTRWQWRESERAALLALARPDFDPRRLVVLEGEPRPDPTGADGAAAFAPAHIASYAPRRVVVESRTARPGILVLTDTFYPGWRAEVDGEPATILRANYLFRAVPVPAGEHRVVFSYAPVSFRGGVAVSLASLGVVGVAAAASLRRRFSPGRRVV